MLVFTFDADDFLRTRFAISPLYELMQSVAALRDPASASVHLPWVRRARERVAGLDLSLLAALLPPPGHYQPDFVSPPPHSPLPDFEEELERVRRTPPAQVHRELRLAYPDGRLPPVLQPLLERPRAALDDLARLLAAYWRQAIAPDWEAILDTLEDDIAFRSRAITSGGPIDVFADLHLDARWRGNRLEVERPYDGTEALGGRGLLLVPSAFAWPRCAALWDMPWQPALIYPARGVGLLWAPTQPDPQGLAALLGARRATVLARLDRETSTSALARRLGLPPSSVSEHLAVLRRAGLVRARRQGREVLYVRAPAGDALLRAGCRDSG